MVRGFAVSTPGANRGADEISAAIPGDVVAGNVLLTGRGFLRSGAANC